MLACSLYLLTALVIVTPVVAEAACNIVNGKAFGDCQNVAVRQGIGAVLNVRSHVTESGIVAGATVPPGGSLHLSGISNGDIVVKKGGQLSLTGVVNATVRNEGGSVDIDGIVSSLSTNGGKASVGGQVGSLTGKGPASFIKGSVLQGNPLERVLSLPRTATQAEAHSQ